MKYFLAKIFSAFFKSYFRLRYFGKVQFGKNILINHRFCFKGKGKLLIGDSCNLWAHEEPNKFQTFDKSAIIEIGKNCRLNGVTIQSRKSVIVGENCLIASAMLIDTDFHSVDYNHRNDPDYIKSEPITIGNNVWIAGQSAILKGVKIGDRSVVGFRALVTKDVPENVVVGGNPAVVIKNFEIS